MVKENKGSDGFRQLNWILGRRNLWIFNLTLIRDRRITTQQVCWGDESIPSFAPFVVTAGVSYTIHKFPLPFSLFCPFLASRGLMLPPFLPHTHTHWRNMLPTLVLGVLLLQERSVLHCVSTVSALALWCPCSYCYPVCLFCNLPYSKKQGPKALYTQFQKH